MFKEKPSKRLNDIKNLLRNIVGQKQNRPTNIEVWAVTRVPGIYYKAWIITPAGVIKFDSFIDVVFYRKDHAMRIIKFKADRDLLQKIPFKSLLENWIKFKLYENRIFARELCDLYEKNRID